MRQYDYLIIGAGLFGSVMAERLVRQGKRCLVIDKRSHIGGNVYTSNVNGITVHQYGAHIFHTNDEEVWEYLNSFSDFNRYTNSPIANYKGKFAVIYTGEIDRYFNYCYGKLEYRSLRFETSILKGVPNYQGNAVMNYTDNKTPYTRIIEHKHFEFGDQPDTVITKEFPLTFSKDAEPYYPLNDERNNCLYKRYAELVRQEKNVYFGGRLAEYKYYNMDQVIRAALDLNRIILSIN